MNKLKKHGIYYDSRIKLLLILLTSALAFALGGGLTGLLLFGVVSLFALLSGLWKTSIKFAIVYIVLLMLAQVLPIHLSSVITFFLLRILTIALALNILFQTTEGGQAYIGNCLIENAGVFHQRDFRYVTANRKSYLQENGQAAEKIKNI